VLSSETPNLGHLLAGFVSGCLTFFGNMNEIVPEREQDYRSVESGNYFIMLRIASNQPGAKRRENISSVDGVTEISDYW